MAPSVYNPRYKITLAFLHAQIFKSDLPIYFLLIKMSCPALEIHSCFTQPYHCNFISLFSLLIMPLFYCDLMFINVIILQFSWVISGYYIVLCWEGAISRNVFRQTQVVLKMLNSLITIYTFVNMNHH